MTTTTLFDVESPGPITVESTAITLHDETIPAGALGIEPAQQFWNRYQLAALHQLGIEGAENADLALFLNYCQKTGLDPFARQIYFIGRNTRHGKRWTIQTGIDGFRIIAERTGRYRGQTKQEWCGPNGRWVEVWLDKVPPAAARIGVRRSDFPEPLYAVATWREYAVYDKERKLTDFWYRMPSHMLSKVAEALALRKAFPENLSGIYSEDEMDRFNTLNNLVPTPRAETPAPATATATASAGPVDWQAEVRKAESVDPPEEALELLRALYRKAGEADRAGRCPDGVADMILAAVDKAQMAQMDEARERDQRERLDDMVDMVELFSELDD